MRGLEAPFRERKALAKQHPLFPSEVESSLDTQRHLCESGDTQRDPWERKLERARRRLSRRKSCGKTGHTVLIVVETNKKTHYILRFHPHRCGSVLCPYCCYVHFRTEYARYFEVIEQWHRANKRLVFWTLTVANFGSVKEAVEFTFKAIGRLYQFWLSPRSWKLLKKEFCKEVLRYRRHLKAKGDPRALSKAKKQIRFFREFEAFAGPYIYQGGIRLGQLLNAIWKFEITHTDKGWHPHWHGIVDKPIPQLLLAVIWKRVTNGRGSIVDVRKVQKGEAGLRELTKYITKHWELKGVSEDKLIDLEASLLGRKKFRVWGFEFLRLEEEKQEPPIELEEDETVVSVSSEHFYNIKCELKHNKNLHFVPKLIRRMRREGEKRRKIDTLIIYDYQGVMEVDLWLTQDGHLEVYDEDALNTFISYMYDIGPPSAPPIDDPELDEILGEI